MIVKRRLSITIDEIVIDVEATNRKAVDAAGSKTSYAISNIVMSPYGNSNDASEYHDGLAQVGIVPYRNLMGLLNHSIRTGGLLSVYIRRLTYHSYSISHESGYVFWPQIV